MSKQGAFFAHERSPDGKEEWLTPPEITTALGPFDLDPCSPVNRPWDTAARHFTIHDDGLAQDWGRDFVWCNPPYGPKTERWLAKMLAHGNGLALIFARTETKAWHDYIWNGTGVTGILFLKGRLSFHHVSGARAAMPAGGPSAIIAYGTTAIDRLRGAYYGGKLAGALVTDWK